jgi:AbrB family looped-hinge helix DNA binding protein
MANPEKKMNQKYAWTVKVGSKGQFVIPKEAREVFGITPGTTLIVLADKDRGMVIPLPETVEELSQKVFAKGKK